MFNNHGPTKNYEDITYQGYTGEKADGTNILVFDERNLQTRKGAPELSIAGNPYGLVIGEGYDVRVKSKRLFGADRVLSLNPSD